MTPYRTSTPNRRAIRPPQIFKEPIARPPRPPVPEPAAWASAG